MKYVVRTSVVVVLFSDRVLWLLLVGQYFFWLSRVTGPLVPSTHRGLLFATSETGDDNYWPHCNSPSPTETSTPTPPGSFRSSTETTALPRSSNGHYPCCTYSGTSQIRFTSVYLTLTTFSYIPIPYHKNSFRHRVTQKTLTSTDCLTPVTPSSILVNDPVIVKRLFSLTLELTVTSLTGTGLRVAVPFSVLHIIVVPSDDSHTPGLSSRETSQSQKSHFMLRPNSRSTLPPTSSFIIV